MENHTKSSFGSIPSFILDDDSLEDGAVRLYGRIVMYSQEGRCWASNKHFAEKHKVDIRTIQRWLKQLVDRDYIVVEIETGGFQTKRNIWIINDFKKQFTKRHTCHPPPKSMSPPPVADVTPYKDSINTRETIIKQQQEAAPAGVVSLSSEEKEVADKLAIVGVKEATKKFVLKNYPPIIILSALSWLTHSSTEISTTLDQALKWACKEQPEIPKSGKENEASNKMLAKELEGALQPKENSYYEVLNTYVEIGRTQGQSQPFCLPYNEKGFKQKLEEALKRYRLL
jgi:hypothetical protein